MWDCCHFGADLKLIEDMMQLGTELNQVLTTQEAFTRQETAITQRKRDRDALLDQRRRLLK
jgi:hypothetical protein